jgi:hypothetical protein
MFTDHLIGEREEHWAPRGAQLICYHPNFIYVLLFVFIGIVVIVPPVLKNFDFAADII